MTECALRTRAYRKQVPFHLNGRRVVFSLADLREIAEGVACRPQHRAKHTRSHQGVRPRHRSPLRSSTTDPWRARRLRDAHGKTENGART
jgi:hypothetical protein